jgi:hypothetical protein
MGDFPGASTTITMSAGCRRDVGGRMTRIAGKNAATYSFDADAAV